MPTFPPKHDVRAPMPAHPAPGSTPLASARARALPGGLLVVATFAVAALGTLGPNAPLAWLSAATLALGVTLLWRPGEPPVLLFIFLMQWCQASTAILQASLYGAPIDDFYQDRGAYAEATTLTLCALGLLAFGMRLALPRHNASRTHSVLETLRSRPLATWFKLYVTFWVIGTIANNGASVAPGLSQILLGIDGLRWAFFFLLAAAHFAQRSQRQGILFYLAFTFELAQGLGGYFSDFKTVFIVTALALMTAGARLSVRSILLLGVFGAGVLFLGVIWTAIKPEYRAFVSGGERAQIVTVDYGERMQKLTELALALDERTLGNALDVMLTRLSYVEFFGSTLLHVPAATPHENGALLMDAIARPFTPRLFFPGKPVIDDSERTRKYSGRAVAGVESGTSISLGWIAEAYIDFGRTWMMAAALGIGLFYGCIQRVLATWRWSRGALGGAVACAILVSAAYLESSITKVTGGLVASLLGAAFVCRFVVPIIAPWLLNPPRPS